MDQPKNKTNDISGRLTRFALSTIAAAAVMVPALDAKAIPRSFNPIKPSAQNVQISPESAKI